MPAQIVSKEKGPPRFAEYSDVQKGYPLIYLLTLTSLVTLCSTWIIRPPILATLLLIPQLVSLVCFCTLYIRIRDGRLDWQFGPGWIRGHLLLSQIVTTHIVRTPCAYGWGFCRTTRGWRFHRGGALAIEIHCRGGRRLRLGTTRAHELQHFVENARGRRHPLS
jgi:hypothetical protein